MSTEPEAGVGRPPGSEGALAKLGGDQQTARPQNPVAVVKRDCPTCSLVEPVLKQLDAADDVSLEVITQDDPTFPSGVASVQFDDDLSYSYHHDIETVPTLLRVDGGVEQSRLVGWK